MNIEIFKNALYYYYGGFVVLEKETPKSIWFNVKDEDVRFEFKEGHLRYSCTCEHCGKKGMNKVKCVYCGKYNIPNIDLCARKLACIFYLEHQYLKRERKRGG